jgi:hypothetical protein
LPSGERRPAVFVGLPKIFSRGMSGMPFCASAGTAASGSAAAVAASKMVFVFMTMKSPESVNRSQERSVLSI